MERSGNPEHQAHNRDNNIRFISDETDSTSMITIQKTTWSQQTDPKQEVKNMRDFMFSQR
jgi:hypothetical protein